VFGPVGIDVIAGPSEILVISDGSADADWIALDLFSQAEHDAAAQAILLTPNADHLNAVHASMQRLLPDLPRRETIAQSLQQRGALIRTRDLADAVAMRTASRRNIWNSRCGSGRAVSTDRHAGAIRRRRRAKRSATSPGSHAADVWYRFLIRFAVACLTFRNAHP
jgi:histidinol dehydrogenase